MKAEEVDFLVRRLLSDILPLDGLEEAILFGSAARGEMTEASDLDIVLIFSRPSEAAHAARTVHQKRKASAEWPTDLLCVDRAAYTEKSAIGGVYLIAREDGRRIYPVEGE
ncbi:MAG: nucleotidyltransferase domain-containing protein [Bdellovibrionota bacterium]